MGPLADVTVARWFPVGSEFREGGRREAFIHEMITGTTVEGFETSARSLQGYDVMPGLLDGLKGKKLLLMVGERDGMLPTSMKGLADKLKGEGVDVEFEVVLGSGHLPMVDEPRAWLDIVDKFLA